MGIQCDKIEMLFLSPECIGQGWCSILIDRAIGFYGATKVDVNEQNDQATRFYLHKGFRIISRDALDEQGNPFPILHLTRYLSSVNQGNKHVRTSRKFLCFTGKNSRIIFYISFIISIFKVINSPISRLGVH